MDFKKFEGKTIKNIFFKELKLHITFEETDAVLMIMSESFPYDGLEIEVAKPPISPLAFYCEDCKQLVEPGENCPLKRRGRLTPCHTKGEIPIREK